MTVSEMYDNVNEISVDTIRQLGVISMHEHKALIMSDAIASNIDGLTFSGDKISDIKPFQDWEDTGEFHANLKFVSDDDIEFTSVGTGFDAIFTSYPNKDTISPSIDILDISTIEAIKQTMTNNIIDKL